VVGGVNTQLCRTKMMITTTSTNSGAAATAGAAAAGRETMHKAVVIDLVVLELVSIP